MRMRDLFLQLQRPHGGCARTSDGRSATWRTARQDALSEELDLQHVVSAVSGPLGCGSARGVDRAQGAIEKAIAKRNAAGVDVEFVVDDLTNLHGVTGPFSFALDYGVLDDLNYKDRAKYVDTLLRLTTPGSQYLLWCFEW